MTPSTHHLADAARLRRAIESRLFLVYALRAVAAWAFAVGTLTAGWRLWRGGFGGLGGLLASEAAAALAAGLVGAAILARRRTPAAARLVPLLDSANRAGGLPSAAGDGVDLAGWALPRLPTCPWLRCRWRPALRLALAGAGFLVGCLWIPVPAAAAAARQRLHAEQTVADIRDQMALLQEQQLVPDEELLRWQEQLENVLDEASGQDPVKTWDALDYLDEALQGKTLEAVQHAQEWNSAMQQAEDALAVMQDLAERGAMSPAEQAKTLAALGEMLQAAAQQAGIPIPPELQESIERLMEGQQPVNLTPEQLRKLAAALQKAQEGLAQSLENVSKLRVLSPEELQRMLENMKEGAGNCSGDPSELALALLNLPCAQPGANGQGVSAESLLAACQNGAPGSGAATRGRGDAALTWSGNTQPGNDAFKPETLPPGTVLDYEHTQVQGVSYGAAQERTGPVTVGSGALSGTAAGATRARPTVVLPRHRQAVEAYFERSP